MRRRKLAAALAIAIALSAPGCAKQINQQFEDQVTDTIHGLPMIGDQSGLKVHAVRSIREVVIHKIAVMPLIDAPDQIDKTLPAGAAQSVTAMLYAQATVIGGWAVTPQDDVEDAMQQLPPTNLANLDQNAIALGKAIAADGVLYGTVGKYRERVGYDYAAQAPAAVAFTLKFLDEHSGQVVWSAKYAREQKALTQNVFDLPNFIANRGRWVRAHDIADEGVQSALANLYSALTVRPIVQGN